MTNIIKHPFAKEMLEYAQDAQTTDKPWLWWEVFLGESCGWYSLETNPTWDIGLSYRRKPQTYFIGDVEVPLPLKVHPKKGQDYFYIDFSSPSFVSIHTWCDDSVDIKLFNSGQVYLNKEDAQKVAGAILKLIPKQVV